MNEVYKRFLDLKKLLKAKSIFLLGPRQTGKSTLLSATLKDAYTINLLESETYREFSTYPERLREKLSFISGVVVIDEIQLAPQLLNEVHLLIEKYKNLKFVLTGSSARKLKTQSVNLLAGRAWPISFHPLTSNELELKNNKDWDQYINRGGIPSIFLSKYLQKDLSSYVGTYLQEEIKAEGLVRSSERFSRFLDVAGLCNGEIINLTKVATDCGIPARTVSEYFKILEDTLLGYKVEPFETKKRKNVATSKFYLFDIGIANFLLNRSNITEDSELFGRVLEHMVFLELKAYLDYTLNPAPISFWRTHSQQEVDFVISNKLAIEVKASKNITPKDMAHLHLLSEEVPKIKKLVVSRENKKRTTSNGVHIIPYRDFFKELWEGKFI